MSRFSSKPPAQQMSFGPSVAEVRKKRSAAAKKAAATRARNKQVAPALGWDDPLLRGNTQYLDDLRNGLHKEWRMAKASKPVIPNCDAVIAATKGDNGLVRATCAAHAADFAEYVWSNCPAVYFDEVLKLMAKRLAVNGLSYGKVIRNQAQALASRLENRK